MSTELQQDTLCSVQCMCLDAETVALHHINAPYMLLFCCLPESSVMKLEVPLKLILTLVQMSICCLQIQSGQAAASICMHRHHQPPRVNVLM